MTDAEIRKRVADEGRIIFQSSVNPRYRVDTDLYAAGLAEMLKHRTESPDLAMVGDQVMNGFRAYFADGDLAPLLLSVEAFAKFLLEFTDADKYRLLDEEKGHRLALTAVLKALHLINNKIDLESPADDYIGAPRFAEHVCRVVASRNRLAHNAPSMSKRDKAQVFQSTCVFLLFAIAEHFEPVLSALLVRGTKADAACARVLALISSAADSGFEPAARYMSDVQIALRRAAENGDPAAMRMLGERLLDGDGIPRDVVEGRSWLSRAAEAGMPSAMRAYASRLLKGDGFEKNANEGERWLRGAAAAGDEFAKWDLGYRLLEGDGLAKDETEGIQILGDCSFGGGPLNIQLAWLGGFDNVSLPKDIKAGPQWLTKAADAGLPRAMCILGERHLHGTGLAQDFKKAAFWLKRAAEAGDSGAWESYSSMLLDDKHTGDSPDEGEKWLRKAAGAGKPHSTWAIPALAERLMTGRGIPQNVDEAADWACRSLEIPVFPGPKFEAPPGPVTMNWITALFSGDALPLRPELGERLLRKAASCGWAWPMRELGFRLIKGSGLERNPVEGEDWLGRAARTGDPASMYLFGILQLQGDLIRADEKEGAVWLRRSAKHGFAEAMKELGNRLIEGIAMPQSVTEGMEWLKCSVDLGYPAAISDFGRRLFFGNGIAQDEERGIALAKRAAIAGDVGAKAFVALVALERKSDEILDETTAVKWLTEAAEAGDVTATLNLALKWFQAGKSPENARIGERLVRNLANAGEPVAMRLLGMFLYEGNYLPMNREESLAWLERAANSGDVQARQYLEKEF